MLNFKENIPLAPWTTMKVGGPARYFVEVGTEEEIRGALGFARKLDLPVLILGGGSNIIIADSGFSGLVMKNCVKGFKVQMQGEKIVLSVGSGEDWDETVERAVESGWAGFENLSGVPGTVGSVPVQNVACYGKSVEDTILAVRAIDMPSGKITMLSRKDCKFRYRDSIFRSEERGRYFITQVVFALTPGGKANVSAYPDIESYFAGWSRTPNLQEMRSAILEIRAKKGMVIMPEYESYMSVGSFFKNPVVPVGDFERVKRAVESGDGRRVDAGRWFWEQADGRVKIAAARLIERCGFPRGFTMGNVGISPKHALAIVNTGGASASEVAGLARQISHAVRDAYGLLLEPEAEFAGFSGDALGGRPS